MLIPQYIHLNPPSLPQDMNLTAPFAAVVVVDTMVSAVWRQTISEWLVETGCLYMMAWGYDCSLWDDSVDWANIEAYDFKDIPDDNFVRTTWHKDESVEEVFWYAANCALPSSKQIQTIVILDITENSRERDMLMRFKIAQDIENLE